MLIIHQRKSAGTSLVHTLDQLLGLGIDTNKDISIFNARGRKLHDYLAQFTSAESPIKSVHLHPTQANFTWIAEHQVPCVILLRNPKDSYAAMFRHAELEGRRKRINGAANYADAEAVITEFYNNWSLLRGRSHALIIYFDDLISDTEGTIKKIFDFYNIEKNISGIELERKRVSSTSGSRDTAHNHEINVSAPSFRYDPDYRGPLRKLKLRLQKIMRRR